MDAVVNARQWQFLLGILFRALHISLPHRTVSLNATAGERNMYEHCSVCNLYLCRYTRHACENWKENLLCDVLCGDM